MVEDEDALRARDLLQQLLDLLVVLRLDALLVVEFGLLTRGLHELEPRGVEREFVLAPARVVDDHGARVLPDVRAQLALGRRLHVGVGTLRGVVGRGVVVERRRDVVRGQDGGGGHCF